MRDNFDVIMDVLVFKTSVNNIKSVRTLTPVLDLLAGKGQWNFALDDCDRILRIASNQVQPEVAIRILKERGFDCCELDN